METENPSPTLSGDFQADVDTLTAILRIDQSFDMMKHIVTPKSGQKCALFFISGFANSQTIGDLIRYCLNAEKITLTNETLPYIEGSACTELNEIVKKIMSGLVCLIPEGDGRAYLMDMRNIPRRGIEEPANDKVLRGARDGFCESLQQNAALVRRRVRDPRLTFSPITLGEQTKTDVCLCYIEGVADAEYTVNLRKKLFSLKLKTVNFGGETLSEALVKKNRLNPFPKVRYTERPDAAAASVLEGGVLVMCDNSPSVMLLPTTLFSFFQETDDFCFPPLVGSYLRIVRLLISLLSLYLLPLWYWSLSHVDKLPEILRFLAVTHETTLPILLQILIAELAIDGMRLASLNTPDSLGSALSTVTGLILCEFALESGWFAPDVILYVSFVTIANFSQTSYELGYAVKFMRLLLLILTAALGGWGLILGTLIMMILIAANTTVFSGRSYLYPLLPFNKKALKSLLIRRPYNSDTD